MTLAILWTQHRWWTVSGKTSEGSPEPERAVSNGQHRGGMPRRFSPRSTSAHDSVDSRWPSEIETSSLVPSVRTPTMTRAHSRASSSRTL